MISAPDGEIVKVGESYVMTDSSPTKLDAPEPEVVESPPVDDHGTPVQSNRIEIPTAGSIIFPLS